MGDFTREKSVALGWLLLFILMIGGTVYECAHNPHSTQSPRPSIVAME